MKIPFEKKVRVYPPNSVTSREGGQIEVDPREAGLARDDVEGIWRDLVTLYETGLHPAIALCLRRRGKVVLDRAIGHARGNAPDDPPFAEKVQATPQTLFGLFSASKMVTGMLIHLLDQRGEVHLDDRVAHYIPEFGRHGKTWVTIRHVLTHRAGIPGIPAEHARLETLSNPNKLLQILCDARPVSAPGRRLAYHALTGGFILAAIIERVSGKDLRRFLQDEIAGPLGLRHFNYGVAPQEIDRVAQHAYTGPPLLPPASGFFQRLLGVPFEEAVRMSNQPEFLSAVIPSGNITTTANEASLFMQMLLQGGELNGVRIFERRTIQRAVAEQSYFEVDFTLLLPVRYSMGFQLGAEWLTPYGTHTSAAFGHLGFTNVVAFADPERDISCCLMTTGKPFLATGVVKWLSLLRGITRRCPRDRVVKSHP